MDDIALLAIVPPAQIFDFETCLLESLFGSLDLGLEAAVREQEGQWVIDEDFHYDFIIFCNRGIVETLQAAALIGSSTEPSKF